MVDDCHVEKILSDLGQPGRFQILFYAMSFVFMYLVGFNYATITALTGISAKHRCSPSEDYISHFSIHSHQNLTMNDLEFGKCFVSLKQNTSNEKVACKKWLYEDGEDGPVDTVVTKWDLVCERDFYPMLTNTLFFAGVLLGSLFTGHMSDQYGRRPILLIFSFVSCVLIVASTFSPNIYVYIAFRFLTGMCLIGVQTTVSVLNMEQTKSKYNYLINLGLLTFFLGSITLSAFVSWLIQVWWKTQLFLTIPVIVVTILGIFVLPESFHWLVVHNKKEELDKHLAFAAKFNGVNIPNTEFLSYSTETSKKETKKKKGYSIVAIFRRFPIIRKRLILMPLVKSLSLMGFYIMTLNAGELSDNPYKVIMISTAFDTIPILLIYPVWKRYGKKTFYLASLAFSGIMCIAYKFFNHLALVILGKMLIGSVVTTLLFYCCDIVPTEIRNISVGFTALIGRIGGIIAPQVVLLGRHSGSDVPVLFTGIILLVATVLSYFLPETKNRPIPKTIEDVEGPAIRASKGVEKGVENGEYHAEQITSTQ